MITSKTVENIHPQLTGELLLILVLFYIKYSLWKSFTMTTEGLLWSMTEVELI